MRGELVADGFDVKTVEANPTASSAIARGAADRVDDSATVGLSVSPSGESAELWVIDRSTNKPVVRRVRASSETSDSTNQVLAVRTVELLRASLLELVLELQRPANPSTPPSPTAFAPAPATPDPRPPDALPIPRTAGIELGSGILLNPGQVPPAFVLVARLQMRMSHSLHARLSFVGWGTRPQVTGQLGAARLQQFWGLGEVVFTPWQMGRSTPTISAGLGALNVRAEGTATWPYQGLQGAAWGFVADGGAGWSVRLLSSLAVSAEAHVALSAPYPVVRQLGKDLGRVGNPAVLGSLTLAGWL